MFFRLLPWVIIGTHYAIPNEVIRKAMTNVLYNVGVAITLGMSKHPNVGPVWNKTIEPVFVDLIDNVSFSIQQGLVKGLRSDNEPSIVHESPHRSETVESRPLSGSETAP